MAPKPARLPPQCLLVSPQGQFGITTGIAGLVTLAFIEVIEDDGVGVGFERLGEVLCRQLTGTEEQCPGQERRCNVGDGMHSRSLSPRKRPAGVLLQENLSFTAYTILVANPQRPSEKTDLSP